MKLRLLWLLVPLLALISLAVYMFRPDGNGPSPGPPREKKWRLRETRLLDLRPVVPGSIRISPDGRRLAAVIASGGRIHVVVDGVESRPHSRVLVESLRFSPDSRHVAYVAYHRDLASEGYRVFLDQDESNLYEGVLRGHPQFSPDGKRLVYAFLRGEKWRMVLDFKKEDPPYDDIASTFPVFSPDSKRVAYAARRDGHWHLLVDGQEGPPCDYLLALGSFFSPDSRHVGYAAVREGRAQVIIDGKPGTACDLIWPSGAPLFSPDSKHYAYIASLNVFFFLALDGQTQAYYDEILLRSFCWSPVGGRSACYAFKDGMTFLVLDGKKTALAQGLAGIEPVRHRRSLRGAAWLAGWAWTAWSAVQPQPRFSPDGKRLAWVERRKQGVAVVIDGKTGPMYETICGPITFSPDGQRVAYVAARGGRKLAVIDGVEGKPYADLDTEVLFSPDSKRTAYVAYEDGKQWLVVDGREAKAYDAISPMCRPVFSPDSRHLAYGAVQSKQVLIVVDETESGPFSGFPLGSRLFFRSPTALHTFAVHGADVYRVEVVLTEERS
jgi:Tol biopolymer transport system component